MNKSPLQRKEYEVSSSHTACGKRTLIPARVDEKARERKGKIIV